ncbi:UNVERIFIED_CONTAM: hypothetical protein K2H54_061927 [Gekko kuhli]
MGGQTLIYHTCVRTHSGLLEFGGCSLDYKLPSNKVCISDVSTEEREQGAVPRGPIWIASSAKSAADQIILKLPYGECTSCSDYELYSIDLRSSGITPGYRSSGGSGLREYEDQADTRIHQVLHFINALRQVVWRLHTDVAHLQHAVQPAAAELAPVTESREDD